MFSYASRTRRNHLIQDLKNDPGKAFEAGEVWVAGRVVGILDDGFVLQDESSRTEITNYEWIMEQQRYEDSLGDQSVGGHIPDEKRQGIFLAGDILEVLIKKEVSVDQDGQEMIIFWGQEFKILAPCVAEFFIKKDDQNYRKMVVDLNLKDRLVQRTIIFQKIREFFAGGGFLEADTPTLVRLPGMEPYLDVFKTRFFSDPEKKNPPQDMYLITSPEYALKKLLVTGFEKVFQIARSFRNKEIDSQTHNPEFSLLEWYRAYASYLEIMEDTENLVAFLVEQLFGKKEIFYQGCAINVGAPWTRIRVKDAFEKYAGISVEDFENPEKFCAIAQMKGYAPKGKISYDDAFFSIFMNEIEPKLGFDKPVILYDYPVSMAALSKVCENDPKYAERFEIYIAGMELANAFTELNDPFEQEKRLTAERKEREKLGKDIYSVDQKFLDALRFGMPPSGGIALGVDRLVMLLTDTPDINNVLFFPQRDL